MSNGQSGWTPGPWLLAGGTIYALDESGSCNRFSVRVEGGWTFRSAGSLGASGDRTTERELEANARLIAAAPDMAEALQVCANTFREYQILHQGKRTPDGDRKAARNAEMADMCDAILAKARGQS